MQTVHHAHFIRIRFHGPTNTRGARWVASWAGWPSDDSRPVRKTFSFDYGAEGYDPLARDVAAAFCAWLSDGSDDAFTADRITLADMGGSDLALLVHTERGDKQ